MSVTTPAGGSTRLLMAKALGISNAIAALSPGERQSTPSDNLGDDYNLLRDFVAKHHPELERILPPSVKVIRDPSHYSATTHADIYVFCEQIFQFLAELVLASDKRT